MAYWDGNKIIHHPPRPIEDYPGWLEEDCGCCNGIQWGGEYPRECHSCKGHGAVFHHLVSGCFALYPGGPFIGSAGKNEGEIG